MSVHQKTLEDLEFQVVLDQVASYCQVENAKEAIHELSPSKSLKTVKLKLTEVSEYQSSFENENRIPNHGFDSIEEDLNFLKIQDSVLEIDGFRRINHCVQLVNEHIKFFKKFKEYYPVLTNRTSKLEPNTFIPKAIEAVIDRFGEIRDDASDDLKSIRKNMASVRSKVNSSFKKALARYLELDLLDDIRESVVENRRVLAVKAMNRRKIKGSILGSSKTGSIVFIEPEACLQHTRELNELEYDEGEEIKRILALLSDQIRYYADDLRYFQTYLIGTDIIYAKAKYANSINGILPELNTENRLELKDAYHPLLLITNRQEGLKTFPQSLRLNEDTRIMVISGPNAGGKSITLKTVGLLQLMLQSGLLIPVHEKSTLCLFDNILTDIGDNQSIENHLSTYSYRLKQMQYFLKKCKENTLFLIDEFGTGTDPELGGALAEAFLEEFYDRKAFGILTTHYANLKLLANELPNMENANMLFDESSLQPTFQLLTGQAGSSFTFEVAQKNGIPFRFINRAKKKVERGKIRFDKTIAKLQKERSKLEKTERSLRANEQKKIAEADRLEAVNEKIQYKLERYQELYDNNQRLIYLGQKFKSLAENYSRNNKKRDLLNELFRLVQIENSKKKPKSTHPSKRQEDRQIKQEVHKKIDQIRKKKKAKKKKEEATPKPRPVLKVGDRVRLEDGRAIGSIDRIEKNKAVVNYGTFRTNVDIDKLELVDQQ